MGCSYWERRGRRSSLFLVFGWLKHKPNRVAFMPTFNPIVCVADSILDRCCDKAVSSGLSPNSCAKNSMARRPSRLCHRFRSRSWNFEFARATSRSVSSDAYFDVIALSSEFRRSCTSFGLHKNRDTTGDIHVLISDLFRVAKARKQNETNYGGWTCTWIGDRSRSLVVFGKGSGKYSASKKISSGSQSEEIIRSHFLEALWLRQRRLGTKHA